MSKIIEEIFLEYAASEKYEEAQNEYRKTHEEYAKADDEAYKTFVTFCAENHNKRLDNEEIYNGAVSEYEKKGFIQGFKLAMQLREECLKP